MRYTSIFLIFSLFPFLKCQPANKKMEFVSYETEKEAYEHYQKLMNIKLDSKYFCAKEGRELKGVYNIGSFAHDRGCMGDEIMVGNVFGKWKELMSRVLHALGWNDEAKRQELALNWVRDVILAWEHPLNSSNKDFKKDDTPDFYRPKVEKEGDDFVVFLWVSEPGGMLPQNDYYQLKVVINNKAELKKSEVLERFTVQIGM